MERQTKTKNGKSALRCTICSARLWLYDEHRHRWIGPYHFQECPEIPGGAELMEANIKDQMIWEQEEYVPREKGRELLRMILDMKKGLPEDREKRKKILVERKTAIHEEINLAGVPF